MHKFVRNLLTEWRKLELPFEETVFVAAVSGGADSVALLSALFDLRARKKLKNRFVIAHFNHDLRGAESDADAAFVQELCEKFDFELALGKGKIPGKGNLEQNARLARYDFLMRTAENIGAGGLLTAHTANDQAETLLINLLRGSGLRGLAGMKPIQTNFVLRSSTRKTESENCRPKAEIRLIRPLLNWAQRADTENYCRELDIAYRLDAMNENLAYSRVRIRKALLPQLAEFNPKIISTLAQTASILRRELELLEAAEAGRPLAKERFLILKDLKNLSRPALTQVLRGWLEQNRGDLRRLEQKHLESIERLVGSRKSGRLAELPGGEKVEKKGGKLIFWPKNIEIN